MFTAAPKYLLIMGLTTTPLAYWILATTLEGGRSPGLENSFNQSPHLRGPVPWPIQSRIWPPVNFIAPLAKHNSVDPARPASVVLVIVPLAAEM
jgi:hypothetical protein